MRIPSIRSLAPASFSPAARRLAFFGVLLLLPVAVAIAPVASALEYGLNCNAPIIAATGQTTGSTDPDVMKATGAQWVRVNFILGPWTAPDDATRRGPENLTWYETYDRIVDRYLDRGVQVYGLIGAESVRDSRRERLGTEDFVADLTHNAELIVSHFLGRVTHYEIFNEPNDWAGGTTAQVTPYWMARYMESVYSALKLDNGRHEDPARQSLVIVTGPLFTHDHDPGGPYLSQMFTAGVDQLEWQRIQDDFGTYPFDGIGFHVYVAQGYESNEAVEQGLRHNLDSTWSAVTALEGPETPKKIYITEFGWNSLFTNEQVQADKTDVAFEVFKADPRIAQAHYFTLTDWGTDHWGLYRQEPYTEANRKLVYDVFVRHAATAADRDDAAPAAIDLPVWFEPGQTLPVSVQYRNTGSGTWTALATEPPNRPWSLAAGRADAGFPRDNRFAWSGFDSGGRSVSPTDQNAWLAGDVAPGAVAAFAFDATAPNEFPRGPKTFVAGMWKETTDGGEEDAGKIGDPVVARPLIVFRSESLVENGDFEEETLVGWTPFGQFDGVQSGSWFGGITAARGERFVGSAVNYGQKNGGIHQTFAAVAGADYGAVAMVRTFREGGSSGDTACRIGLDPTGGVDPTAPSVVWSAWTESQGAWTRIAVNATAAPNATVSETTAAPDAMIAPDAAVSETTAAPDATAATVFLQTRQQAPVWNITCFDDVIVGGPTDELPVVPFPSSFIAR